MELVLLLSTYFAPDLTRLGADEWRVREAESRRLDNPLSALLLPVWHEDPEVNYRLQAIRTKNLKFLNGPYVERLVLRADFDAWATAYLFAGRSRAARDPDVFELIHDGSPDRGDALFRVWPCHTNRYGFLYGAIRPGEYEDYLDWLDYHQGVAPVPREKQPTPE